MKELESVLKSMDLKFFAEGHHKTTPEKLFATDNAVFLDVRADQEIETVSFPLKYHVTSLHIPTDEIPDRLDEIPGDRLVGIFCSAATRAAMVYTYLRAMGYNHVRILVGGYGPMFEALKPGKLKAVLK